MEDLKEISAIWRSELARALRSGRFVALLLLFLSAEAVTLGLGVGAIKLFSGAAARQTQEEKLDDAQREERKQAEIEARSRTLGPLVDREEDAKAIAEMPLLLVIVFVLTAFFSQLLIAFMGFDTISGETTPKTMSIRYLMLRARRSNIVLGKYLTQLTTAAALLTLCVLVMVVVAKLMNEDFAALTALKWTGRLTFTVIVVAVTATALTTFCSSLTRVPALGLFANLILMFAFLFFRFFSLLWRLPGDPASGAGALREESWVAYLRYLSPGTFEGRLLGADAGSVALSVCAHLGFAFVFLGLAQVVLRRRDL